MNKYEVIALVCTGILSGATVVLKSVKKIPRPIIIVGGIFTLLSFVVFLFFAVYQN